ncbi:MAG: heavy metal translocating P-type ATPase, partial [Bacteroidetes bacterium]|nr:heavy metal translocating P-type ATPase [Bacteroidota bacterium]
LVGISIADDVYQFSPACDAILDASNFHLLNELIKLAKKSVSIVHLSFALSFLYNIIGLSVAVQGLLSPIFAAILMPLSSISVVIFTSISTRWIFNKSKLAS